MENLTPITDPEEVKTFLASSQIISPSFQLYDGASGFQDFGIVGTPIKHHVTDLWRRIMFRSGDIHEVETPVINITPVLMASGHIDKFFDLVVHDRHGKCHRADHLVKNAGVGNQNIDEMSATELEAIIKTHHLVDCDPNDIKVQPKTLMMTAGSDYLRPELAQGIFVNMKQYLDYFANKLPFGIAQVGPSFRREVSSQPFVRLRSFNQMEIEYVFDPQAPTHRLFDQVRGRVLRLLPTSSQTEGTGVRLMTVGRAVRSGLICNQIMGYFLAKLQEFAEGVGLDPTRIRFRQHLPNEMAHYALQCWDLECQVFTQWLECAGCAHRGDHDLRAHNVKDVFTMKRNTYTTKTDKTINIKELKKRGLDFKAVARALAPPSVEEIVKRFSLPAPCADALRALRASASATPPTPATPIEELATTYALSDECVALCRHTPKSVDQIITEFAVPEDCVVSHETKVWDTFIPHVLEPSIGLDRVCYALLVQNICRRLGDEKRIVLRLCRAVSPYNVAVFPLSNQPELNAVVDMIVTLLTGHGLRCLTEYSSVSIGKRYVRADEIGVDRCITVDFDTLSDNAVTIRTRDTMAQVRVPITGLLESLM